MSEFVWHATPHYLLGMATGLLIALWGYWKEKEGAVTGAAVDVVTHMRKEMNPLHKGVLRLEDDEVVILVPRSEIVFVERDRVEESTCIGLRNGKLKYVDLSLEDVEREWREFDPTYIDPFAAQFMKEPEPEISKRTDAPAKRKFFRLFS